MADATVAGKPGLDPTLPVVPIILGGVERHLAFDYNAIVQAEKVTGVDLLNAIISDINATHSAVSCGPLCSRKTPSSRSKRSAAGCTRAISRVSTSR